MGNRKNLIYGIILAIATVLFIAGMVKVIFSVNFTVTPGKVSGMVGASTEPVNERLNYLDSYVAKHGPDVIYNELFYGHSYEPEFDKYWEFADIQIAGVRGRFANDKEKYRKQIENYIEGCDDAARIETAKKYLEIMEE